MIFFGHLGITLAGVRTFEMTVPTRWSNGFIDKMDYRFVLLGSILPDLIDKPVIFFLSHGTRNFGRLWAHSLLFVLILCFPGFYSKSRRSRMRWSILAICSFIHLGLDMMWKYPDALLWPFKNIVTGGLRAVSQSSVVQNHYSLFAYSYIHAKSFLRFMEDQLSYRSLLLPELSGMLIVFFFFFRLVRRKKLILFLKTGQW